MSIQSEIIKLKKEIHNLREHNADLQMELEEKNQKLGKIEAEYLKMKNETLLITKTKLMNHQEIIRQNVEKLLENEKERINFLEKNYEEALKKISYFEQEKKNLENHQKELQVENNQLKKQIQDIGKKTQALDFINDIKSRDEAIMRQTKEYQKIVKEWNELCDKMQDLISENRLLRELANVPENYGINLEEIKLGDRMKIEDYKAKIRILQREVDDLETERAQLKHKLIFFANSLEIKEPPFSLLNTEQKQVVAEYAQSLYEGREFIVPERYELLKENQNLKNKIELLEKQIGSLHLEANYKIYGMGYNNKSGDKNYNNSNKLPEGINEIIDMLRKENEDLKALLNKSLDKLSLANEGITNNLYKNGNMPSNLIKESNLSNDNYTNISQVNSRTQGKDEYSYGQLPPIPLIDKKDVDATSFGYSYRFNTKIKIDPNQIHTLFGIAKNDEDVTELKIESASLQMQLIETLEILTRMQTQDEFLHSDLEKLFHKFETLVLMQNELFEKYTSQKKTYTTTLENNTKTNKSLLEELQEAKRKLKAYEDTIALIESKNPSQIELKVIDKMKENAILEMNYLKLSRKYEAIIEEESKLRKFVDDLEKNTLEKDKQLEATIIKLKEWKQILGFYTKFLIKKLKKSVDRDEFDRVIEENRYLREKYNEIVLRDINVTRQISLVESYKIKFKEVEENYYNGEEMRIDSEVELFYLKKKLQDADPEFHLQEIIFRKFLKKLNENRVSFSEMRKIFDPDNSGKITRMEFRGALKTLGINEILSNEKELTFLIKSLNYDEEDNIDTFYFLRKLERVGLVEEKESSGDEQILTKFIQGVKNSGMSLKSVFELFDTSGDGVISKEEFKFALQQLKMNLPDDVLNRIIILINSSGDPSYTNNNLNPNYNSINYARFCELFEQNARLINIKSRKNSQIKSSLKIDWKTNMISSIIDAIKINDLTFTDAFKFLDKDNSGQISKDEFTIFLRKISVMFGETEIDGLFKMLDQNQDGTVALDEFLAVLKECEQKIQIFKNMTNQFEENPGDLNKKISISQGGEMNNTNYNNKNSINLNIQNNGLNSSPFNNKSYENLNNKLSLLQEKEKYFSYKINQMRKRLEDFEKINKETSSQLEEYVAKHTEMMNKYFTISEELQRLKSIYESSGVKREDLQKIEMENDNLLREVNVLRVGLNTFKDLHKSSTRQTQILTIKSQRNLDEMETFKKAIKDLQSESNSNALLGKLYYSLLISRWRESNTLRKYEDLNMDYVAIREENFRLETENKQMIQEISELQTVLHNKIIENLRLEDYLQNFTQGFNQGNGINTEHLEELKSLIRELSNEKTNLTEKYFLLRKENLKLDTECEELRNKVEYADALVINLKSINLPNNQMNIKSAIINNFNYDEYSKRLIQISEDLSKSKLQESIANRENVFLKERESYLEKLIEHLNNNVKNLEISNNQWESKFRKMEEMWRKRDEERQKKFFENVKSLNITDMKILTDSSNNPNQISLNFNPSTSSDNLNINNKLNEFQAKIKELNDIIQIKNSEINRLININKENEEILSDKLKSGIINDNLLTNTQVNPLLSKNNLDILKDDETQLVAQTAHKTIKTLQDLLDSKSSQLNKKDETIENLKNDLINMKSYYLDVINKLHDQIHMDHDSTMTKLKQVLSTLDQNLLIKISKSQLSTMTLADLEALIEEKDMTIKTLALELNKSKEENDLNYVKIQNLNMQINELNITLTEQKYYLDVNIKNEEIERLKKIIREKSDQIEEEKIRIKTLTEEFSKKYQDKTILEEQLFKSSVYIPERIEIQSEKTEMYGKIQSLRNKNKKLRAEIDKLNKIIDEFKKQNEENLKTLDKLKNENKMFLQTQIKDTKLISRMKKEKEDLYSEKEKFKEKADKLELIVNNQSMLNNATSLQNTNNNMNNSVNQVLYTGNVIKRPQSAVKKKINEIDKKKEDKINLRTIPEFIGNELNKSHAKEENILRRLVYYCIKKNINMERHLQRYDLTKLGKITKTDFCKAIDELKLGFIESDIQIIQESLKITEEYVTIQDIVAKMISEDKNYESLIIKNEFEFESINLNKKQPSKKYFSLENKNFNLNY